MGSCSSSSAKGKSIKEKNIKESQKNLKKNLTESDLQSDRRDTGALKKRMSVKFQMNRFISIIKHKNLFQLKEAQYLSYYKQVNYNKIPNKIHKQDTRFQQGIIQDDEISGLVGLTNLGNTCFMNSALQCLSNVPPLCDYFLSKLHEKEINFESFLGSKGQITQKFGELMLDMWQMENTFVKPSQFLSTIGDFGPQFADGSQQDSHEFLAFLMDILHEDLNRVKKKPYIEGKDYHGNTYEEYAKESWSEYLQRNRSIIVDLFQGQTKSTLKCLKCSMVSHKFETFMYLSVPIPKQKKNSSKKNNDGETFTLSQCIKEFTKEEKLEKGEQWFCPKCKKHVESTKKIDLWKMPNVLIIHMKRFEFNENSKCKLRNPINFPIKDFDITSLTGGKQRDKPTYDLFAITNHGGTLTSGHYTSYAKNRIDQNWYFFNDSQVQQVEDFDDKIKSSEAYVLFYSKTSVDEFFRQTLTAPESWPHFFSEKDSNEESKKDESNQNQEEEAAAANKRKRTKLHTYKFTNTIQDRRDSKLINLQLNNGSKNNLDEKSQKQNNVKSQAKLQSATKFDMNDVQEEDHQGNLDDSINGENTKYDKNFNSNSNQKQIKPESSQVKVRNDQYFGKDQRTGESNALFSPKGENSSNQNNQQQQQFFSNGKHNIQQPQIMQIVK